MVPSLYRTGTVLGVGQKGAKVALDHEGGEEDCEPGECFTLRWHERRAEGEFLVIAKAWNCYSNFFTRRSKRILRLQSHQIYDGVLGRRWIMAEYHNGRLVKGK